MAAQSIEQNRGIGTEFEFDFSCVCSVLLREATASFWTPLLRIAPYHIPYQKYQYHKEKTAAARNLCAV